MQVQEKELAFLCGICVYQARLPAVVREGEPALLPPNPPEERRPDTRAAAIGPNMPMRG